LTDFLLLQAAVISSSIASTDMNETRRDIRPRIKIANWQLAIEDF
jgi:hypothetical protein